MTEGAEHVRVVEGCPESSPLAGRCLFEPNHQGVCRWQNGAEARAIVAAWTAEKENR